MFLAIEIESVILWILTKLLKPAIQVGHYYETIELRILFGSFGGFHDECVYSFKSMDKLSTDNTKPKGIPNFF